MTWGVDPSPGRIQATPGRIITPVRLIISPTWWVIPRLGRTVLTAGENHHDVWGNHPDDTVNHHNDEEEFATAMARGHLNRVVHLCVHAARHHHDMEESSLGVVEKDRHTTEVAPLGGAVIARCQLPPDCWPYDQPTNGDAMKPPFAPGSPFLLALGFETPVGHETERSAHFARLQLSGKLRAVVFRLQQLHHQVIGSRPQA